MNTTIILPYKPTKGISSVSKNESMGDKQGSSQSQVKGLKKQIVRIENRIEGMSNHKYFLAASFVVSGACSLFSGIDSLKDILPDYDDDDDDDKNNINQSNGDSKDTSAQDISKKQTDFGESDNDVSKDGRDEQNEQVKNAESTTAQLLRASCVRDTMAFGEAFAHARNEIGAGGIFVWHGKLYGTYTREEWQGLSDNGKHEYVNKLQSTDAIVLHQEAISTLHTNHEILDCRGLADNQPVYADHNDHLYTLSGNGIQKIDVVVESGDKTHIELNGKSVAVSTTDDEAFGNNDTVIGTTLSGEHVFRHIGSNNCYAETSSGEKRELNVDTDGSFVLSNVHYKIDADSSRLQLTEVPAIISENGTSVFVTYDSTGAPSLHSFDINGVEGTGTDKEITFEHSGRVFHCDESGWTEQANEMESDHFLFTDDNGIDVFQVTGEHDNHIYGISPLGEQYEVSYSRNDEDNLVFNVNGHETVIREEQLDSFIDVGTFVDASSTGEQFLFSTPDEIYVYRDADDNIYALDKDGVGVKVEHRFDLDDQSEHIVIEGHDYQMPELNETGVDIVDEGGVLPDDHENSENTNDLDL